MIHTADLQRSKRLKELGWEQECELYWLHYKSFAQKDGSYEPTWSTSTYIQNTQTYDDICKAPMAGEMIEWLLGEGHWVHIFNSFISLTDEKADVDFKITDGNICNALADACAWVLERNK